MDWVVEDFQNLTSEFHPWVNIQTEKGFRETQEISNLGAFFQNSQFSSLYGSLFSEFNLSIVFHYSNSYFYFYVT